MSDPDDVVSAYWRHYQLAASQDRTDRLAADDLWWAWETVEEVMDEGGVDAVELIVALAEAVDGDELALAYLGAGPVEDLLRHKGPPTATTAAALEDAARASPNVRSAIGCMYWPDGEKPELRRRFEKIRS